MKKIAIQIIILTIVSISAYSQSYKFIALDNYFKTVVPIDSILVRNMATGEDELFLTDSIAFEVQTSIGIENTFDEELKIYPNPSSETINIKFKYNQRTPITIMDVVGRVQYVSQQLDIQNGSELTVDVSGLSSGMYNLQCGNVSQNFIKSGKQSNNEVKIINYNNTSLVKENIVQSQFDYKFTIYSDGFHPRIYYSKSIENDSTITLEMTPFPSAFDYKHVRVELFFKSMKREIKYFNHNPPFSGNDTVVSDYKSIYLDTLVVRNGYVNQVKNYKLNSRFNEEDFHYDKHRLEFEFDSSMKSITKLYFVYEYNKIIEGAAGYMYYNEQHFYITLKDEAILKFKEDLFILSKFSDSLFNFSHSQHERYTIEDCSGHHKYFQLLGYDIANSYIKIEFLE